jgi:hypothetical protein
MILGCRRYVEQRRSPELGAQLFPCDPKALPPIDPLGAQGHP